MAKYCNHCMKQLEDSDSACPACGRSNDRTVPAHHLLPGTVINRRYSVGYALGEGGFGITYIGRDMTLDIKVAIKEFYPNGYVNRSNTVSPAVNNSVSESRSDFFEKGKERFLNEARILAKFSGEAGIVEVRDFFEENSTAYIVMEFLEGRDLKEYLKKNGTLTPEYTVKLLMPVMNSLKKIHAQGLIHRDISPDNIMVIGDKVKLLDFGAARSVSAEANKSLSVMLKPGYAPEEQYRSKGNQGPWTDVYALCATMYKCITGITPDDATQRVFEDEVQSPTALGITIDRSIENAIMKGMAVNQKDRYQSIDELLKGLKGIEAPASSNDKTLPGAGKALSEDDSATLLVEQQEAAASLNEGGKTQANADAHTATIAPANQEAPKAVPKEEPQPEKAKKKSKGLLIGIIAALVIAAAVAVWFLLLKDDSGQGNTGESLTEVITMSDNLFDFTFELEGDVFRLPCSYSDFTDKGWQIDDEDKPKLNSSLAVGGDVSIYLTKGDSEILVTFYNRGSREKTLSKCKIGGITVAKVNSFVIAKGIRLSKDSGKCSTPREIEIAFGEAYADYDDNAMIYLPDGYSPSSAELKYVGFELEDSAIIAIGMANFAVTDDDLNRTRVFDSAGLLNDSQEKRVAQKLSDISNKCEADLVILTVDSLDGKTPFKYASDFYESEEFGFGERYSGAILLVAMDTRDWTIVTCGEVQDIIPDSQINIIAESFVSDLTNEKYYDAFLNYIDTMESKLSN